MDFVSSIPVILAIDVEPDEAEVPQARRLPWRGFEAMTSYARELRPRLAEASGAPVRFNWFLRMDAQIAEAYGSPTWVAETYRSEIDELLKAGDGFGLHPHAWRWKDPPGRWLADNGRPEWVDKVMRDAFAAFQSAFGRPCVSHRFGDRYLSAQVVRTLRELGVRTGLTVEPGAPGNHRGAPRSPYQPSDGDPMIPSSTYPRAADGLWMIPMTSFNPDPLLPRWRRGARRLRHPGLAPHRPIGLATPFNPQLFWRLTAQHLDQAPVQYLAFVLRSDVAVREPLMGRTMAKMEALLTDPVVRQLRFTVPDEVVARVAAVIDDFRSCADRWL
jgi:peptidoglycan/xylan/chitin deacetylase (PgdA/CDA1 family)